MELPETIRLDAEGMRRLCTDIFVSRGVPRKNAEIVSDNLITADLRGVPSHGVARIKSFVERSQKENWNPDPSFRFTGKGAVRTMDADDGFGSVSGLYAMAKAMELAGLYGIGMVAVRRSSHFGTAAQFALMAARHDMIGFCCSNGAPSLAPHGAIEGMLGTSPFGVAFPVADHEPLVLDIACSVAARGNIAQAKREGQTIPEGWAVDANGNPTTDPALALLGAVLPFAGHKGSGIAVMIDMLCGLLNQGIVSRHQREDKTIGPGVGHTMIAIDISFFQEVSEFKARAADYLREMKSARPAPSVQEIFLPGEQSALRAAYNRTHGIPMGRGAFQELCDTCRACGIATDPHDLIVG